MSVAHDTALIIDDEPRIRAVVASALAEDFGRVLEATTGREGLRIAGAEKPSLIVLDLGLPDISGASVCEEIRKVSDPLILVLSARHGDREKAALLDAGADDYVTKPFSTIELKARVRALQRRARAPRSLEAKTITNGDLEMDLEKRTLSRSGTPIHLTPTEWELARVLMIGAGKTMTHRQLFAAVWAGRQYGDAQQHLRVHIASIQTKDRAESAESAVHHYRARGRLSIYSTIIAPKLKCDR